MDAEKLDERILQELHFDLRWMPGVEPRDVAVKATVKSGVATLSGHVRDPSIRRVAEKAAKRVLGVRSVVNEIRIHHPSVEAEPDVGHSRAALDPFGPGQQSPD